MVFAINSSSFVSLSSPQAAAIFSDKPQEIGQSEPPHNREATLRVLNRKRRVLPNETDKMRTIYHTPPARVPELGINFFENLTENEFRSFSLEQISHMSPEQVVRMLLNTATDFLSERLSQLSPVVFRKFSADHFNQLAERTGDKIIITKLTKEQIHAIPVEIIYDIKERFFNFLKPEQIASLLEDQIAEIHPEFFKNPIFLSLLLNLNQNQIRRFTANQLRKIPVPELQRLVDFFSDVKGQSFFELLTRAQLSWLTSAQIASRSTLVRSAYFILHCRTMPKFWVRKLTQQELGAISPSMLRKLGRDFLEKLTAIQLGWLTPLQKEQLAAGNIQIIPQAEEIETPRQKYLSQLSSDKLYEMGPLFPTDLNESEIAILTSEQLSGMASIQIEYQGRNFFSSLSAKQLAAFNKSQIQAIRPNVIANLGVDVFWAKLLPMQPQIAQSLDPYGESFSRESFRSILESLTKEQVAHIPLRVFKEMGDDFILGLNPLSFAEVPAEMFRYIQPNFVQNMTLDQIARVTPQQVMQWTPAIFSELMSQQIVKFDISVCQELTVLQLAKLKWSTLLALPPHKLNPQVFAAVKSDYLVKLSPEAFSLLSADHINALANSPYTHRRDQMGNLIKSHPILEISKEQLRAIRPEVIGGLNKDFFQILSLSQFSELESVQYQAISTEIVSIWENGLDEKGMMFYNKLLEERGSFLAQVDILEETLPPPSKRQHVEEGNRVLPIPETNTNLQDRRAIVVVVSHDIFWSNHPTQIRQAIEYLLLKHPGTEVYALNQDADGHFQQWKFNDSPSLEWTWEQLPQPLRLGGEYNKITLLAHGDDERQMLGEIDSETVGSQFCKLLMDVTRLDHINILACGVPPTFGVRLYHQLAEERARFGGLVALIQGALPDRITGSEFWTYIAGDNAEGSSAKVHIPVGAHLYEDWDRNVKHGVSTGKWQVQQNVTGQFVVTQNMPSRGDGRVVYPGERDAGPFGYIGLRREIAAAQQKVNEAIKTLDVVAQEVQVSSDPVESWVAVIDEGSQEGEKFLIPVIEKNSGRLEKRELSPEKKKALLAAREQLKPAYEGLKPYFETTETGQLKTKEGATGKSGSSSTAFFTMALIQYLRERKSSDQLQLSVYWNLGGMGTAVAGEGVELGKLVSQFISPERTIPKSLQILSRAFEVGNISFQVGSMGWDLYQLITTKDPVIRVGTGIQLGFTSGAVALQGGSMAMGFLAPAAVEVASAFGELAGPLMALGFGFSALGIQIKQNNAYVHGLLKYFIEFEEACRSGGFTHMNNMLVPQAGAVINKVDFEQGQVTFESPQVLKSIPAKGAIQYLSGASPRLVYVPGRGYDHFDLREELEIEKTAPLEDAMIVLLPYMSNRDIHYGYSNSAAKLDEKEKKIAARLKAKGNFVPSNSWGNLRAAFTGEAIYQQTAIDVNLGKSPRVCWFSPVIDKNVSYKIKGKGGEYVLRGLHSGVRMSLNAAEPSSFLLEVEGELKEEEDIVLNNGVLAIRGQIRIDVRDLHPNSKIRVVGTVATWNVDLLTQKKRVSHLDLRKNPQLDVADYLGKMALRRRTENVVILVQGALPLAPVSTASEEEKEIYRKHLKEAEQTATRIGYDTQAHRRMGLGLEVADLQNGSNLVGITEKKAFFFNKETQTLWHTDRVTNQAVASYQLRFATAESRIESVFQVKDQIFIQQVIPGESQKDMTFLHVLKEDKIQLVEVRNLAGKYFELFMNFPADLLADIRTVRIEGSESDSSTNFMEVFARQLPCGNMEQESLIPNLPIYRAEIADWIKIGGDSNSNSPSALVNLENAYSVRLTAEQRDYVLMKSWSYPPSVGGMGLLLWSPSKKAAQFVKLAPGDFNPTLVSSAKQASGFQKLSRLQQLSHKAKKLSYGMNPSGSFHNIMVGKKVIPFEENGEIYLVTEDGSKMTIVDCYGKQIPVQYQLMPHMPTDLMF